VAAALHGAGVAPTSLVLELTETVLVTNPLRAASRLAELRDLGVRIAIDDFGTGYSSLSYLQQFPFDILKIDRSFTGAIGAAAEVPAIVTGIIDLARALGLQTVAEGIELTAQRDQLTDHRCDHGQGYLFARPLRPEAAAALLRARPDASPSPRRPGDARPRPAPDVHEPALPAGGG
jgi:EAL domain-containing protein (putative c-di-GMP-specific phosphodiesterase class I)